MDNRREVNGELREIMKRKMLSRKRLAITLKVSAKTVDSYFDPRSPRRISEDKLELLREKFKY